MILDILKIIAAIGTIGTGLYALVRPRAAEGFTGLTIAGPRGVSEVRAVLGGLFIGLGAACFIFGPAAYQALGLGYLAIAAVRLVSIFLDKSSVSSNWISLAVEIVFGVILILP
jgi:hypothetical protein